MAQIHNKYTWGGSGDATKASYVGIPFNYSRGSAVPLDETSYFEGLAAAQDYAKNGTTAYVGQILTIVDSVTKEVSIYKISNAAGDLVQIDTAQIDPSRISKATKSQYGIVKIGDGIDVSDGVIAVTTLSAALSGEIDSAKSAATTAVGNLSTSLSNTVDAKVTALKDTYLPTNYLSVGIANGPTAEDKLLKRSEVEAKINALDAAISTLTTAETIKSISETDGVIAIEKQSIQIDKTQVNDLTSDLTAINTKITGLQDISASIDSRLTTAEGEIDTLQSDLTTLTATTLPTLSGQLTADAKAKADAAQAAGELSAQAVRVDLTGYVKYTDVTKTVTSTNRVVTEDDIKDLSGAMHFIGVATLSSETEDPKACLVRTFPNAKKGDVAIIDSTAAEYVYVGETKGVAADWRLIGDENTYATKVEMAAEVAARAAADTYISGKVDTISTDLDALEAKTSDYSNTWKAAVDLSVSNLSTYASDLSTDLGSFKSAYDANKTAVALSVAALCAYAGGLSTDLGSETAARIAVESFLSGKIDNKVKIGTGSYAEGTEAATYNITSSDLSVVKISDEDYYRLVSAGKQDDNVIYIVSADNLNGHDQRVIKVGAAVQDTDAVNLSGMNAAIATATAALNALSAVKLNGVSFDTAAGVASLTIDVINCGGAD